MIEIFREIRNRFNDWKINWALIGGLAVSSRSEPRFTKDIDIVISVKSDMEAESLAFRLNQIGWNIELVLEQSYVNRLSTIRFVPPNSNGVVVDILFASSGIEDEICQKADDIEIFKDVSIPVAQVGHLIALKILSVEEKRPQDAMDLQNLIQVSTTEDLNLAMESCNLIQQRGFHRERDLTTLFKEYQRRFGNKEG